MLFDSILEDIAKMASNIEESVSLTEELVNMGGSKEEILYFLSCIKVMATCLKEACNK